MEKNSQVTSPQKSPVPSEPAAVTAGDTTQTKTTAATNRSAVDQSPQQNKELSSSTYKDTSKSESPRHDQDSSTDSPCPLMNSEEDLPHPIISVDIQKSMPYENKQVVPQPDKDTKDRVDLSPEMLVSVVTTAVVTEAALTVGGADGHITNGNKFTSDSSKVDAVVEQALNKISETMSDKTEIKTLNASDASTKPIPNGDIDHSPIFEKCSEYKTELLSEELNAESSAQDRKDNDKQSVEGSATPPTQIETLISKENISHVHSNSEVTEELGSMDINSCNGIKGIITVESISKTDTHSDNEEIKNAILVCEKEKEPIIKNPKDDKNSDLPLKDESLSNEDGISKSEEQINVDEEHNKTSRSSSKMDDSVRRIDDKKVVCESTSAESTSEANTSETKTSDNPTAVKMPHDNLTDSAKLHKMLDKTEDTLNEKMEAVDSENTAICQKVNGNILSPTKQVAEKPVDTSTSDSTDIAHNSADSSDLNKPKSNMIENKDFKDGISEIDSSLTSRKTLASRGADDATANREGADSESSHPSDFVKVSEHYSSKSGESQNVNEVHEKEVDMNQTGDEFKFDTCDMNSMTSMMTSQILTEEMLNSDENVDTAKQSETHGDKNSPKLKEEFEKCRISATRITPVTCDVGVGLDEQRMIRVASGDGGEEEVDGQEATTEVEVTDDANTEAANVVDNGAPTPTAASPSGDRSPTSAKTSAPISKASSAASRTDTESPNEELSKPSSAASRSSIPEPIVYEPPERRKSAASASSDDKKDDGADKSQQDEKESEKNEETISAESSEKPEESNEESKEDLNAGVSDSAEVKEDENEPTEIAAAEDDKPEETPPDNADISKADSQLEDAEEVEKGEKDENEKESKSEEKEESIVTAEIHEQPEAIPLTEEEEKDAPVTENAEETQEENEIEEGVALTTAEETETATTEAAEEEDKELPITSDAEVVEAEAEQEKDEAEIENAEIEKTDADKDECDVEHSKVLDEPKTLVEESSEKEDEAKNSEEKEEDETEIKDEAIPDDAAAVEKDDKGEEKIGEIDAKKEEETAADGAAETAESEEKDQAQEEEEQVEATEEKTEEGAEVDTEVKPEETEQEKEQAKDDQEEIEKTDDVQVQKEEEEKGDEEKGEVEKGEEEKEEEGKGEEVDETPEPPPKSPTKRMRSPDKAGRRGVSPASSPPKPLRTPPSPQKPQKSTSPKKKNGMLSPIKTPKTPGSDIRKLPPIKAPVGLAPNPNLKNIRSKIGSFDNIRYKPGGGDKKVISKKLDWKATPKIGSLDHSFKSGEKKHGKSHSKGDTKDVKLVDGQSPLPSGDEGEHDAATEEDAEKLIKPDVPNASDLQPTVIAAES